MHMQYIIISSFPLKALLFLFEMQQLLELHYIPSPDLSLLKKKHNVLIKLETATWRVLQNISFKLVHIKRKVR